MPFLYLTDISYSVSMYSGNATHEKTRTAIEKMEEKNMRKRLNVWRKTVKVLAAAAALGTVVSAGFTVSAEETEVDPAVADKKFVVGLEGTYAPYCYHGDDGELIGFEVDVAKAIAEKIGYEVEFAEIKWDSMFEALDAGTIDVVMNQVTITDERKEKYDFTTPYVYTQPVLIVKSDNEDVKSFDDIKGLKAAEGLTSNYNQIARDYGAEIVGQDEIALALQCVLNGEADVVVNDFLTYSYWTAQTGDTTSLKVADTLDDVASSAIVINKGRDELRDALSEAIDELLEEGKISEISETYFNTDVSKVQE